jgi:hypothetical protein
MASRARALSARSALAAAIGFVATACSLALDFDVSDRASGADAVDAGRSVDGPAAREIPDATAAEASTTDDASAPDAAPPPPFCATAPPSLLCADFDAPATGLVLTPRTSGGGVAEESEGVAASRPRSLRAKLDAPGAAQVAATFAARRDGVVVNLKVFLPAPTSGRVVIVALELANENNRLEVAATGAAVSISATATGGGQTNSVTRGTSIALGIGRWTPIRFEATSLTGASEAWIGNTTRVDRVAIPTVGHVVGLAIGAAGAATELYVDDLLVLEK